MDRSSAEALPLAKHSRPPAGLPANDVVAQRNEAGFVWFFRSPRDLPGFQVLSRLTCLEAGLEFGRIDQLLKLAQDVGVSL